MADMETELRFAREMLALQRKCDRVVDKTRPPSFVPKTRVAEWGATTTTVVKPLSSTTRLGGAKTFGRYAGANLGRVTTRAVSGVKHSVQSRLHLGRDGMDRGMAATFIEVQVYIGVGLLLRLAQLGVDHWPQLGA